MSNSRSLLCIFLLISIFSYSCSTITISHNDFEEPLILSDFYQTTRKQAVIDYVLALYSPEDGAFYSCLRDWPTDPRIGITRSIFNVYYPHYVLNSLQYTSEFDWTDCISFLQNLVNPESRYDAYGPVNTSIQSPCSVITCKVAIDIFSELDILYNLDTDEIQQFISTNQYPNGGFSENPWDIFETNLINTQCALYSMDFLNSLNEVDTSAASDYVLSCYDEGKFAYTPGGEYEASAVPLGLMCLDYLDAMDSIDKGDVFDYLLTQFDNSTGHAPDKTIVDTERLIWSFSLIDTLDQVNTEAVANWVLDCQSPQHGAFLPYPGADPIDERLEWSRAACHILELVGKLDLLDEEFTVIDQPEHTIPQAYYDFIEEHLGTTTNTGGPIHIPQIDVVGLLVSVGPPLLVLTVISTPFLYYYHSERKRKSERKLRKKRRGP